VLRGERSTVASLRLQTHTSGIRRSVQSLIRRPVIGSRRYANRDRDSGRPPVVRTWKEMAADSCTESFRNFASGGSRSAKKGYELVSARVSNQFSFTQVRAGQVEDRAQHRLGVRLTKLVGEPSIVIDVSDEQRYRTTRRARLGDRCRCSIDEGVVRSEPSLLI